MNNAATYIYFAAVAIALFCLLLIFLCRHHLRHFPRYLLAFIAVETISLIFTLLLHTDHIHEKNLFLFLLSIAAFTSAPLVWLYARECKTASTPSLAALWPVQILAILGGIVFCFPLLLLVDFGNGSSRHDYIHSEKFWLYYYSSLSIAGGLYLLQGTGNLIASYGYLCNDHSPRRAALKIVLLGLGLHILINILRALQCKLVGVPSLASLCLSLFDILITLTLLVALLLVMLQETLGLLQSTQVGSIAKAVDKYQRSALGPEDRSRIRQKLEQALNDPTLVHNHSLNLRKLAEAIGERPHYVSQVINQDMQTNFFDLINAIRIRNALPHILANEPLAIVDIAETVGFNSKSTFYSAFAKQMGVTPSQYRQNQGIPD